MRAFFCPPHLLTLDKSCTEHLIDHRLYKTCCDFSPPIPITVVRNEGVIGVDVVCEILHRLEEFWKIRTRLYHSQLLLQIFQLL